MRPLVLLLTLAACSAGTGAGATDATSSAELEPTSTTEAAPPPSPDPDPDVIALSLSLYLVSDGDDSSAGDSPDGGTSNDSVSLGTQRSVADVEAIVADIGPIWAQAGIAFDPVRVIEIDVPADVLAEIASTGRTDAFFAQAGRTFEIPDAGAINGFYVREAGGVNGFTPSASRVFFVVDEPTVNDERVSSHEIGHILGLHHALLDSNRLMFSGTNGESLTESEQAVARYSAQGVLDGVR